MLFLSIRNLGSETWDSRPWTLKQKERPTLASPGFGETGRGTQVLRPVAFPAPAGRSRPHSLLVTFRYELPDRLIRFAQRRLIGQEHDAEVAGARLLSEAGAVDDQDMLLAAQFLHENIIAFGDFEPRESVERPTRRDATHSWELNCTTARSDRGGREACCAFP